VMMDQRAHGESGGELATYGWLERSDTRAVIDALVAAEHPMHIFALGESMGAGIALQSAGVDPRIEAVVAEAPFASLREASYDYAGLQEYPLLGKTLFAPGAWVMLYRGGKIAGFSASGVSPERAVAGRSFPVLLICDEKDTTLPCRHAKIIYAAARGPKSLWIVPGAFHTAALGFAPEEFRRRVLDFFRQPAPGPGPVAKPR
jgi:pimeloyl-ACP methyl ester carboxylesterase